MSIKIKLEGGYKFKSNEIIVESIKGLKKDYYGELLEMFLESLSIEDFSVQVDLNSQIGNSDFLDLELYLCVFKSKAKKGDVKAWWGTEESDYVVYSAGNSILRIKGELNFQNTSDIEECNRRIKLLENKDEFERNHGRSFSFHSQVCGVSNAIKDNWIKSAKIDDLNYSIDKSIICLDENTQYEYYEIIYICSRLAKSGEFGVKFGNEEENIYGPDEN